MNPRNRLIALAAVAAAVAIGFAPRWGGDAAAPLAAQETDRPVPVAVAPPVNPWKAPAEVPVFDFLYTHFETIGVEDGLPSERVTCLLVEDGRLAVGTEHGLALRDGEAEGFTVYGEAEGLSHPYVTSIARDAETDALWISTLSGLNRLSGGKIKSYTQTDSGLMNDVVYHVLVRDRLIWCATAAGVSVLDERTGSWELYDTGNSIMHEPWCYAIALGPARAWVGIWGGGIDELDLETRRWREYRDPDGEMELDLLRDDGPLHDVSSFVAYDAGVLWQSTYFGLSRYDGRRWDTYVAADTGLPGDFIHHVHARGHTAWISTDQGFGVFDGETSVSYRRREDGQCDLSIWKNGKEVEQRVLPTSPASNYVLWAQGGERDAWLATAGGLCHATLEPPGTKTSTGGEK